MCIERVIALRLRLVMRLRNAERYALESDRMNMFVNDWIKNK